MQEVRGLEMFSRDEGALRFRKDREEHIALVVPPDREGLAVGRNHHEPWDTTKIMALRRRKSSLRMLTVPCRSLIARKTASSEPFCSHSKIAATRQYPLEEIRDSCGSAKID